MSKHVTLIENLLRVTLTKDGPLVLFQSEEVERVAMAAVGYPGRNFQILAQDLRNFQGKQHLDCDGYQMDLSEDGNRARIQFTVGLKKFERIVTAKKLETALEVVDMVEAAYVIGYENCMATTADALEPATPAPAPVAASKPAPSTVAPAKVDPAPAAPEPPSTTVDQLAKDLGVATAKVQLALRSIGYTPKGGNRGPIPADKADQIIAILAK